jgi:drug/metabolite transporter (DMT)-like permease
MAIAIADVFLKQASHSNNFVSALKSGWFWAAIGMYIFQVVAFTYLFVSKIELSVVGIIQTVLYAAIVLGAGFFIYKETFTPLQYTGLGLALLGVILINLKTA